MTDADGTADPVGCVPIDFVVVPYDDGRRGWRMGAGPLAFVEHGLPELLSEWGHDVLVDRVDAPATDPLASAVQLGQGVAPRVRASRDAGRFPIVLAGNCTATLGAVAGVGSTGLGVVWLDAHGDLNTPATSPSGFLDGMAGAMLLGWCHADAVARIPGHEPLAAGRLLAIGGRAFDPGEREQAEARGVRMIAPHAAAREAELERALDEFAAAVDGIYLHIDLDVLDPSEYAPANAFTPPGGLTFLEVVRTVQEAAARRPIRGLTLSAYDPAVDPGGLIRAVALPLILEATHDRGVARCSH
jgi:arginase